MVVLERIGKVKGERGRQDKCCKELPQTSVQHAIAACFRSLAHLI